MALGVLDALGLGILPALVGMEVGFTETDGFILGLILGCDDGFFEGFTEVDGFDEGSNVGTSEVEGIKLGLFEGLAEADGLFEGLTEVDGFDEGFKVGTSEVDG